jgi:hypothetical protein
MCIACEMSGELDPCFRLDHAHESFEHLVEQFDLLRGMPAGAGGEQVADARKRPQLLFGRSGYLAFLDFIDESLEHCHGRRIFGFLARE